MLDWFHFYRKWRDVNLLENYIPFETLNMNNKRLNFIKQIQTSYEFYPEARKKQFKNMLNVESKDAGGLEELILSWHPEAIDFDSLSLVGDKLLINRADVIQVKDQRISSFYMQRYEKELLEYLSQASSPWGIADYFGFDIVRSIGEDSVYVGNYTMSDYHYKFAFILNDFYFPLKEECEYKIPWSDTLNVQFEIMENRRTHIDTTVQNQIILRRKGAWRSAALSFGQSK